jgi:hypothetical protein
LQRYRTAGKARKWLKISGPNLKKMGVGMMTRMPALNSSCLSWVEYDSGTMRLTFNSGRRYTLYRVPEHHYVDLLRSSSPGSYFNDHLKGRYSR